MSEQVDTSTAPVDTEQEDVSNNAAASTANDVDGLDTSPDKGVEDEETMSDFINKALEDSDDIGKDPDEKDLSSDDSEEEVDPKAQADGETDPKLESPEKSKAQGEDKFDDGADVPEDQRVPYKRFKKMLDQSKDFKGRREEAVALAESYRHGHDQHQAITSYMADNELTTSDVAEALQISALMMTDPVRALEMLAPKIEVLQKMAGDILPADVQEQVDRGDISEEAAQNTVRTHNENIRLQLQRNKDVTNQRNVDTARQTQESQTAMADAANLVGEEIFKSDPDYAKKAPMVRDRLSVLIRETNPATAEQAGILVRRAHKEVTQSLRSVAGVAEIKPSPSSSQGGRSTATGGEDYATMADAISAAANN